jgi:hypothetical protein
MKRTTVKLPDDLDARLRHEAARRKLTISELTRQAIEAHLGGRRRLLAATRGKRERREHCRRGDDLLHVETPLVERRQGSRSSGDLPAPPHPDVAATARRPPLGGTCLRV